MCSVHSNSENVQLKWQLAFPTESPLEILYDHASTTNTVDILKTGAKAILINFTRDNYIESLLELTIVKGVPINRTKIECSSENLDNANVEVFVNTSGIVQGVRASDLNCFISRESNCFIPPHSTIYTLLC